MCPLLWSVCFLVLPLIFTFPHVCYVFCWSVLFLLFLDSNPSFHSTLLEKERVSMAMPAEVENTFCVCVCVCVCVLGEQMGFPVYSFCAWQQWFFLVVSWQSKWSTLFCLCWICIASVNFLRLKSNQANCSETPLTSDPCWSPHLMHIRSWHDHLFETWWMSFVCCQTSQLWKHWRIVGKGSRDLRKNTQSLCFWKRTVFHLF